MNKSIVVKIEMSGNRYNALAADGTKYTSDIGTGTRKRAFEQGKALERRVNKAGNYYWWKVPMENFNDGTPSPAATAVSIEVPTDHAEVMAFIHGSYGLKPRGLMMSELKWKFLMRSAVRGKNIMMTGAAGCGKTMAAKALTSQSQCL